MQRTVGSLVVVIVALAGCKQRSSSGVAQADETTDKFRTFVTTMCACRDKACAVRVQEAMTKWAAETTESSRGRDERPDEATMKQMAELGVQYAECTNKAMELPAPAEDPAQPPRIEIPRGPVPVPVKLSSPADRPTVAKLVAEAKAYTRATEDHLAVHVLKLSYVASDGMLDPTYGELAIELGDAEVKAPAPVPIPDDPARPTGAPIPEPPPPPPPPARDIWSKRTDRSRCPTGRWTSKAGWTWDYQACTTAPELVPRCSTAEIWNRATAKRAPANAVAIMELQSAEDGTQSWKFSINDPLRKVDLAIDIADTCTAVVEKP